MQLLIYTEQTSERLTYTFDFILGELLGLAYNITCDKEVFASYTGAKMSYSPKPVGSELFFECASLLFESDITAQPIDFIKHDNLIGFYRVSDLSAMPFDLFASSFLMLSRYNEYLLHKKDKYHRYRASQSLNYVGGFLSKPMVNYYALYLKKLIGAKYPELQFGNNRFEYIVTVDVETTYAYAGKGLKANTKGFIQSLFQSNFADIKKRYQVLFRNRKDPFDTFDEILAVCKKYAVRSKFFFQVGNLSEFDTNLPHTYGPFKEIMRAVSQKSDIGIHLSYMSHISNAVMEDEIQRLEHITGVKVTSNRFHYLRFTLPASYVSLSRIGITEDYSLGYATRSGFRAGTCTPYFFYNLIDNVRTNVKIYPFAFMDTTLAQYNKLSADESLEKILQIMKWVKEVEGPFIGLWHNSSFTETGIWKGWKNVFETVAREAAAITAKSE